MKKQIICTVCPMGCHITVEGTKESVTSIKGYNCERGKEYGSQEFLHPVRILTTTLKVVGRDELLSVRSDSAIPKELMMDCMKVIHKKTVHTTSIRRHDIVIHNICGSGINMVATNTLDSYSDTGGQDRD